MTPADGATRRVRLEVRTDRIVRVTSVTDGNLDLPKILRAQLEGATVHDVGLCTMCHPELFFSHRRDGGDTGRQAGVVWRV